MKTRINRKLLYILVLAAILTIVVVASQAQETGTPTDLNTTVVSKTEISLSWTPLSSSSFESPVQLSWFYIPHDDDSKLSTISNNFDQFVLTKNFEDERDYLQDNGHTVLQYTKLDGIHDPCFQADDPSGTTCNCNRNPLRNQAAWQPGDICFIRDNHPEWFLRDANGNLIYSSQGNQDVIIMDPGQQGYREFWLERLRVEQIGGWDGIFIDNMATTFTRHGAGEISLQNYTPQQWRDATTSFLKYIRESYFAGANKKIFANLSVYWNENNTYFQYLQYLDGTMDEHWAVRGNDTDTYTQLSWEDRILRAEETLKLGKEMMFVSRGTQGNNSRQRFSLASYLLVAEDDAYFRYTRQGNYGSIWLYDNYDSALGNPSGSYYRQGNTWLRDFENGRVSVTPSTNSSEITVNGGTLQVQRANGTNGSFSTLATISASRGSYSDDSIQGGGEYCYRLKITNTDGTQYSNVSCKTAEGNGSSAANSPVGTINTGMGNPLYSWQPTSGVSAYYLYVATSSGQQVIYLEVKASEYCNASGCSIDPTTINSGYYLANGDYVIYISPVSSNGLPGQWSGPSFFSLNADAPAEIRGLTVSSNQGRPSVEWPDDENAAWYQFWVGSPNYRSTEHFEWYKKDNSMCSNGDCRLVLNTHPTNGNYVLFMRSWGAGGFSEWAGPFTLNLNFDAPSAIEPLTPTNTAGTASGSRTFRWRGAPGATWYEVWVGTLSPNVTTAYLGWKSALDAGCEQAGVCELQPGSLTLQSGKTYEWYVRAWGPGGYSTGGEGGWYKGANISP